MKTLIIIPAYNEEESLGSTVSRLTAFVPDADYLVVNDGSSDGTVQICRENGYPFLDLPATLDLPAHFRRALNTLIVMVMIALFSLMLMASICRSISMILCKRSRHVISRSVRDSSISLRAARCACLVAISSRVPLSSRLVRLFTTPRRVCVLLTSA